MNITFHKYHGTGNDFILIDNREHTFPSENEELIGQLCQRHTGIGADGLILLENDQVTDFKMVYFNADGRPGSMCGNGGRCIVAFAKSLGIISKDTTFNASDGIHQASIDDRIVSLKMQNVRDIRKKPGYQFLNTGSPHHVQLVNNLANFEVLKEGKRLRYGLYGQKGSNINFVESVGENAFSVRTYERGVENETLSCGTGVTAVALAMYDAGITSSEKVEIQTKGGTLDVVFHKNSEQYTDIFLIGPAVEVYKGEISC